MKSMVMASILTLFVTDVTIASQSGERKGLRQVFRLNKAKPVVPAAPTAVQSQQVKKPVAPPQERMFNLNPKRQSSSLSESSGNLSSEEPALSPREAEQALAAARQRDAEEALRKKMAAGPNPGETDAQAAARMMQRNKELEDQVRAQRKVFLRSPKARLLS
jgi:flagellar biosynthesis/type III secretory pathway protein FliH